MGFKRFAYCFVLLAVLQGLARKDAFITRRLFAQIWLKDCEQPPKYSSKTADISMKNTMF